jgi:hypothetical protein
MLSSLETKQIIEAIGSGDLQQFTVDKRDWVKTAQRGLYLI